MNAIICFIQHTTKMLIGTEAGMQRHFFSQRVLLHSVATPLTVLKQSLTQLQKSQQSSSSKLNRAMHAAEKIEHILFHLLDGKAEKFCLIDSLQEVVTLLQSNQTQITLIRDARISQSTWHVFGCRIRLQEAISCLISNAIQAYERSQAAPVIIGLVPEGSGLRIQISDYGCGMNYWQQKVAVLPLLTLRSSGTGIGLSLARWVIERDYQGQLEIFSHKRSGTSIKVWIPVTKA